MQGKYMRFLPNTSYTLQTGAAWWIRLTDLYAATINFLQFLKLLNIPYIYKGWKQHNLVKRRDITQRNKLRGEYYTRHGSKAGHNE
jgi:hypothetical protein